MRGATIAPILPTHDLRLTFDFLDSIGFETYLDDDGDEYGFARRGPIDLHYSRTDPYDPFTQAGMAYIYVLDADALYEELLEVELGCGCRLRRDRRPAVAGPGVPADRPRQQPVPHRPPAPRPGAGRRS